MKNPDGWLDRRSAHMIRYEHPTFLQNVRCHTEERVVDPNDAAFEMAMVHVLTCTGKKFMPVFFCSNRHIGGVDCYPTRDEAIKFGQIECRRMAESDAKSAAAEAAKSAAEADHWVQRNKAWKML